MGVTYHSHRDIEFSRIGQILQELHTGFFSLATPLTRMTRKKEHFEWQMHVSRIFKL